ncbi:MAG: flagellar biosynthetic protein FliR [Lachnospiraceae bacterium]|nr:flagellar biosynthetic protein FliR [Lachnospiraceae bacterium]
MIEYSFSIQQLEYFLAIFVRVMGAMAFAPIFGNRTVTRRVRIFIGVGCALAVFHVNPYVPLGYSTFLEYTVLLLKELTVGLTMGFMSNVTLSIIGAAGQFIDREIGFSMVSEFDQSMNTEVTITAEFYNMLVMLIMLCSNMHYFILTALSDSFQLIPLGNVSIDTGTLYDTMVKYMADYFIISIRIALPVMISIMLLNVVLGVLAKTAPQMNMFVIGMQLKIFVGFAVLFVTIGFLPTVTDYIYKEMQVVVTDVIQAFVAQ